MGGTSEIHALGDAELVSATLRGSDDAFAVLVGRYKDLLFRHAERMTGRADDAEDIVQAAFIKGYRNLRTCRNPERVGSWLFRIGANACKDYLKSRRRSDVSLEEAPDLRSDGEDADEAVRRGRLRQAIDAALQRLAEDQREAFVLKHVEGRSYAEMSELLGVTVPALKMRVHRAREELQELLRAVAP
ncbi:MAG: RNA polymerase sigma factor [Gemmatimonadota bacterium]